MFVPSSSWNTRFKLTLGCFTLRRATALLITQFGVSHWHSCFIMMFKLGLSALSSSIPLIHLIEPASLFRPISNSSDGILHKPKQTSQTDKQTKKKPTKSDKNTSPTTQNQAQGCVASVISIPRLFRTSRQIIQYFSGERQFHRRT